MSMSIREKVTGHENLIFTEVRVDACDKTVCSECNELITDPEAYWESKSDRHVCWACYFNLYENHEEVTQ